MDLLRIAPIIAKEVMNRLFNGQWGSGVGILFLEFRVMGNDQKIEKLNQSFFIQRQKEIKEKSEFIECQRVHGGGGGEGRGGGSLKG